MTTKLESDLAPQLRAREQAIMQEWRDAITRDGFVSQSVSVLTQNLSDLTHRVIDLVLGRESSPVKARTVGAELAEVGRMEPSAYGSLLGTLVRECLLSLYPGSPSSVNDRIAETVAGLTVGLVQKDRERVVEGQEAVRRALVAAEQETHDALRSSEERYRAVVTQAREGVVLSEAASKRIVETNVALQNLLGYSAEELATMSLYDISANEPASIDAHLGETLRNRRHDLGQRWLRRKDGVPVPVESSAATVVAGGQVLVCALVRDISQRIQAEADLAATQRLLAEARETERLRIAQDLHDDVVQELLGLRYQLTSVAAMQTELAPADVAAALQAVRDQLATTVAHARQLVAELRPTGLDEAGLVGALENFVADVQTPNAQIVLDADQAARDLPRPVALCLFRVAQESVRNALRHGNPSRVTVWLRLRPRAIILRVSDDGCGFSVPDHLGGLTRGNHFGLAGIAERVGQMGGRLRVRSRPGWGTYISVWLPPISGSEAENETTD